MAKKLTAAGVRAAGPGVHGDAHGLRLLVRPSGARCWVWRGTVGGKRVDRGLGGWPVVTLAEARDAALDCKRAARRGDDPRTLRAGGVPTFAEAAERVISLHEPTWKGGGRTAESWRATLRDYVLPRLADKTVDEVTAADVLIVLTPIWHAKPAAAGRVRVRIGAVMKWAIAEGHRVDNPAGDPVTAALPRQNGGTRHHRAVGHADLAGVLAKVQEGDAWIGARLALAFVALTATRAGEVCGMTWGEIDGDTWNIPGERMKTGKPHRIPLARQSLAILDEAREVPRRGGDLAGLVFPAAGGKAQATRGLLRLLTDVGAETSTHGFRTAFRSWCADSGVDRELAEMALGHVVAGVEGAYQRSDLLERRAKVMQDWADYITPK